MIALPLEDIITEVKVRSENSIYETLTNLQYIYSLPFDPDIMYDLFDNYHIMERLLSSSSRGSGINGEVASIYSMDDKETWRYYPNTVQEFLSHCKYVWGIEPIFDAHLVRRNFNLSM